MKSEEVFRYLKEHPEFFEEYADFLSAMQIPHPHGGRAIPIAERQVLTLREKSRVLEGKLRELVQFGEENDTISERVHRITLALLAARNLPGLVDSLYNNLNATVTNANQLLGEINKGNGSLGKLAKDKDFAKKLDDTVTRLDSILSGIDEGKGTIGQLMQNRSLYDHADQTMDQAQQLIKAIREDPRKYFIIRLKVF